MQSTKHNNIKTLTKVVVLSLPLLLLFVNFKASGTKIVDENKLCHLIATHPIIINDFEYAFHPAIFGYRTINNQKIINNDPNSFFSFYHPYILDSKRLHYLQQKWLEETKADFSKFQYREFLCLLVKTVAKYGETSTIDTTYHILERHLENQETTEYEFTAFIHYLLSEISCAQKEYKKMFQHIEISESIAERLNVECLKNQININYSIACIRNGFVNFALHHINKIISEQPAQIDSLLLSKYYIIKSEANDSLHQYNHAISDINKAIELLPKKHNAVLANYLLRKAHLFQRNGAYNESEIYIKQFFLTIDSSHLKHETIEANRLFLEYLRNKQDFKRFHSLLIEQKSLQYRYYKSIDELNKKLLSHKINVKDKNREKELLQFEKNHKVDVLSKHKWLLIITLGAIAICILFLLSFRKKYLNKTKFNKETEKQNKIIEAQNQELDKQKQEIEYQTLQIQNHFKKLEQANNNLLKMSKIIEQTENGIMLISASGKIEWINKGFERMHGFSLEELKKVKGDNIFDASHNLEIKRDISYCIANKQSVVYISKNITKLGKQKWIQTTLSPIINESGELKQLIAIDTDYTPLKIAENEIVVAQKSEEANKTKNELLASISNEVLTPLDYIIEKSKELNLYFADHDKESKSYIETVLSNSFSLQNLINDIIDFSKIQTNKFSIKYTLTNIKEFIDSIIKPYIPTIQQKKLHLIKEFNESLAIEYCIDLKWVRQIINNVFNNAVKFTEKGFVKIIVNQSIPFDNKQEYLQIQIEDSGIGMNESDKSEIFNAFCQVNPDSDRKFGGTGLGLTITKHLLDALGGLIEIESKPLKGTIVIIYLPIKSNESNEQEIQIESAKTEQAYYESLDAPYIEFNFQLIIQQFKELDIEKRIAFYKEEFFSMQEAFEKAQKSKSINDLKNFATKLKFISHTYNLYAINDYQEVLSEAVLYFNIKNINYLIKGFENITLFIESQIENQLNNNTNPSSN